MPNLDALCRSSVAAHPDAAVAWFLCTSYLYYQQDISVISDACFDDVCKGLLARWHEVKHPHKHFIEDFGDLSAGSGFALPFDALPQIVYGASAQMRKEAGV